MSTYIRGPICGVANCPSRLWRIIDGRRTCQYGHVMEGDIEFNNEEEDVANSGVITRRLNLTTNATGSFQSSFNLSQSQNLQNSEASMKVYGDEAHKLFLRSFQLILKTQTTLLIDSFKFPKEFEHVVKIIWTLVLKSFNEEDTDEEINDSIRRETRMQGKFKLSMTSSIAILYMACVHTGLPVYANDLMRWLSTSELPFFKAREWLPGAWKEKLPNYYLGLLEGVKVPHDGQLFVNVAHMCFKTNISSILNCELAYEALIFKLITRLVLPPEFYIYTVDAIEGMDCRENFRLFADTKRKIRKYYMWAEIRVLAYFILTVRWVLLMDHATYPLKWIESLMKTPSGLARSAQAKKQHIAKLSASANMEEVFNWDRERSSDYLEWVEKRLLTNHKEENGLKIDHKIALRRLHKILPLESQLGSEHQSKPPSYIEELQEKYIFFQTSAQHEESELVSSDPVQRLQAVQKLEAKLINDLAIEHGCSSEQLKDAVLYIDSNCASFRRNNS